MKAVQEKKVMLSGNTAIAYAVKQLDVDVIPAYPITPSTTAIEKLSEYVAKGELKAKFITVESEHSGLTIALSAVATGARSFTATSAQGLLLMHEILHIVSGFRLPVVMAVATRAISAPISIWNDHSDAMAQRDTGWIQIYVESVQEAYDRVIQAFRLGEDARVRFPVMVIYDGVILSHTYEPIMPLTDEEVRNFSPRQPSPFKLDPAHPITIGGLAYPDSYYESKYQQAQAFEESQKVFAEVDAEYEKFGRRLGFFSQFMLEDAEWVLVAAGAICGTLREGAKRLRKRGIKAGVLGIKLYRPFPSVPVVKALGRAKAVGVVEKALSLGAPASPILADISTLFYNTELTKTLLGFVAGLGGRDVTVQDSVEMFQELQAAHQSGERHQPTRYVGLRSDE